MSRFVTLLRSHTLAGRLLGLSLVGSVPTELTGMLFQMQSMAKSTSVNRPAKMTVFNTLTYVYKESGIKGLYRGVTPRIGLGIW